MINTKPTEIANDLFQALKKPDQLFMDQAVQSESGSYLTYQELDPLFKAMLLGKLYCYFLYPPYCLCDYYKKRCACHNKRQQALKAHLLKTYLTGIESIGHDKVIDLSDRDIQLSLTYLTSELKLSREQALKTVEYQHQKLYGGRIQEIQHLTGIKDQAHYDRLQESLDPEAKKWFEHLTTLMSDSQSYFTMALGIARHLMSQIHAKETSSLLTPQGQKGHLSFNQIVMDVLNNKSLDFFGGIKFSKIKLMHAFHQYRSLLHLILGHFTSRIDLDDDQDFEITTATFVTAHEIQKLYMKHSKGTYTASESKALFTKDNLALVPDPSVFLPRSKQEFSETTLALTNTGWPHLRFKESGLTCHLK